LLRSRRCHLIGGALVACGDIEHVAAPIFMRFARGRLGELAREAKG
jgi:hypothetical protein